jgi:hypothetical protein
MLLYSAVASRREGPVQCLEITATSVSQVSAQPRSLAGIGAEYKLGLANREYKLFIMPSTSALWDSQPLDLSNHGER